MEAKTKSMREAELEALMAKAGRDASGKLASALAYRPEYLQVHGEMNELRKTSADKNCGSPPPARLIRAAVRQSAKALITAKADGTYCSARA